MTSTSALIQRARLEMGDTSEAFQSTFTGDGVTKIIALPRKPVDALSLNVTLTNSSGSLPLVADTDYTLDATAGILIMTNATPTGSSLTVTGYAYQFFTDNDWQTFVGTALVDHLHNRQGVDIVTLPIEEEYPVAILAVVQALYALVNEAAFQIDVSTGEGVSIPRTQRYHQLMEQLLTRQNQYNQWCMAFNVGLWRVENFNLRRISRSTNKLIPIYQPQEYEDTRPPFQVFPPIDTHGGRPEPVPTYEQTINLVAEGLNSFEYNVVLNKDITGRTVRAQIRRYPQALTPIAWFNVTVNNLMTGDITLSLDGYTTYYLGLNKFWDLTLTDSSGNVTTVVGGTFDAVRQGGS